MDISLIWKAFLIVLISSFLLRLAGRKTISEMTIAQTVLIISFGTLIIQPVVTKTLVNSFIVGGALVTAMLILEFIQIKSIRLEHIITGKPRRIITDGTVDKKELAKLRLTKEQLEMNLREKNIHSIGDIKWATLEPSGKVGFSLKDGAQPANKDDIIKLQQSIDTLSGQIKRVEKLLAETKRLQGEGSKD